MLDGMFDYIRKLLGLKPRVEARPDQKWDPQLFIYVMIPGDIQPIARGMRFEDPLQAALDAVGLGEISGGGSQLDDPYPDGRARVKFCGIDVDATDRDRARELLMEKLVALNAPPGTELQYTKDGSMLLDRLEDGGWKKSLPRTVTHPGFGV